MPSIWDYAWIFVSKLQKRPSNTTYGWSLRVGSTSITIMVNDVLQGIFWCCHGLRSSSYWCRLRCWEGPTLFWGCYCSRKGFASWRSWSSNCDKTSSRSHSSRGSKSKVLEYLLLWHIRVQKNKKQNNY